MGVNYRVEGKCPACRRTVVLLDESEPIPAHQGQSRGLCEYRGLASGARRRPIDAKDKDASEHRGASSKGRSKKSKRDNQSDKTVSQVVREGNRRLYTNPGDPRSRSVKTVSGGLPSLGK